MINRQADSTAPGYLQCFGETEKTGQRQNANANYAPPSARGKMRTWCDGENDCPSGSWCCVDNANSSGAAQSGRCVYCNDNDSFCWTVSGDETPTNTCAVNNMTWWNSRF